MDFSPCLLKRIYKTCNIYCKAQLNIFIETARYKFNLLFYYNVLDRGSTISLQCVSAGGECYGNQRASQTLFHYQVYLRVIYSRWGRGGGGSSSGFNISLSENSKYWPKIFVTFDRRPVMLVKCFFQNNSSYLIGGKLQLRSRQERYLLLVETQLCSIGNPRI